MALLLRTARRHLAAQGAAALSLRAIARDMGMAPSALFRYTANRDELLTLLIITAYNDLGDRVDAREQAVQRQDTRGRWAAAAQETRSWALDTPHEYALIYGSPVPDYAAPAQLTNGPGSRVPTVIVNIVRDVEAARNTQPSGSAPEAPDWEERASAAVADLLEDPLVASLPAHRLVRAISAWNLITGAISAEVFQQLGPRAGDTEAQFTCTVDLAWDLITGE